MNPGSEGGEARLRVSVVIPIWRDTEILVSLLPKLSQMRGVAETIVVNASRDSASERIARDCGVTLLRCSPPNRGAQMNVGAQAAGGEVLLFQHADAELTEAHLAAIHLAMRDPKIVGGAFYRKFDDRHPRLRWLEPVAHFLSRNGGTLYGDQSIFVRREIFQQMGGFAKIPLMEDVEFSKRLRAAGKVALLNPPMQSSARYHLRKGAWRATMRNVSFIALYRLGVCPFRLHRWHYQTAEISRKARTANQGALAANRATQ